MAAARWERVLYRSTTQQSDQRGARKAVPDHHDTEPRPLPLTVAVAPDAAADASRVS